MIRKCCLILAVLMVFSLFSACKSKQPSDEITNSEDNNNSEASFAELNESTLSEEESSVGDEVPSSQAGGGTAAAKSQTQTTTSTIDKIVTESTVKGVELPKANIEGKTVKVMSWWAPNEPSVLKVKAQLEKRFKAKLEWQTVGWGSYTATYQQRIMADTAPDVVMVQAANFPTYVYNNWWKSLDGLIDWDSELWKGIKDINLSKKIDGKTYVATYWSSAGHFVWYNKNMLTNEGQPDPQTLYANNQWTWDKMLGIARAVTKPSQGIYGLNAESPAYMMLALQTAHKVDFIKPDGKKYALNLSDPNLTKVIDTMTDIFSTWKIYGKAEGKSELETFGLGKTAMHIDGTWIVDAEPILSMHKKGTLTLVPLPKMGNEEYAASIPSFSRLAISNTQSTQVDAAVAFINLMRFNLIDEATVKASEKEDKERYNWTDKEFQMMSDAKRSVYERTSDGFPGLQTIYNDMADRFAWGRSWSQIREVYEGQIKKSVDDMNKLIK